LPGLLEAGADVTVVAPGVRADIRDAGVRLVERGFEEADLEGAWLAIAAAPGAVNRQVAEAAAGRRLFVNAVDDVEAGTAYGGGVLRRAGITIAISTDGAAPALAGLLREGLDAVLPEDLAVWVDEARRQRAEWKKTGASMSGRRPALLEALNRLYDGRSARPLDASD